MKFRIKKDEFGKYVQKKNIFGIWRNWLVRVSSPTILGRYYCNEYTEEYIIQLITEENAKKEPIDILVKEFEV